MKKLIAFLGVAGLMALVAVPAMAGDRCRCRPYMPCPCKEDSEVTVVENGAVSYADTGMNEQDNTAIVTRSCAVDVSAWTSGARDMDTGHAVADAFSSVEIGAVSPCVGPICGLSVMGGGYSQSRPQVTVTRVSNYSDAAAFTGGNSHKLI